MEYVDNQGKGLYRFYHESSWTDLDNRILLYEILSGVNHTHSLGIVHKDLKPQNIMIDKDT